MAKKDKDPALDEYHKLKRELIRENVNEIFRKHPTDSFNRMKEIRASCLINSQYCPAALYEPGK